MFSQRGFLFDYNSFKITYSIDYTQEPKTYSIWTGYGNATYNVPPVLDQKNTRIRITSKEVTSGS